jgi:hypothetical protein
MNRKPGAQIELFGGILAPKGLEIFPQKSPFASYEYKGFVNLPCRITGKDGMKGE